MIRAQVLALDEVDAAARERWRELAARATEPNPFFEPEFVLPAAATIPDAPGLLVAIDGAGDWAGAAPLWRGRGWHHVPLRGAATWDHLYSFFGAPLVRAGDEREALRCWLEPAAGVVRTFLGLDLLDAGGPVLAALEEAAAETGATTVVYAEHERAALFRDEDGLSMRLSSKRRRENARLGRRLGEALGDGVAVVDRSEDPRAVEDFMELEAAGWKGGGGTALASSAAHAEFFRRMCEEFRQAGRLQFLSLEGSGRLTAMKCDLIAGSAVYCFKTSFDESLAEFSPGVQLERALADHEKDNERVHLIDTCAEAGNEMANRVWPDRRRMVSLAVSGPGLGGTLSRLMIRATAQTRTMIRRNP